MRFIRERARDGWIRGHLQPMQAIARGTLLDPEALTIGFARRFATYKRATLLFRDLERLKQLLHNRWRPVQIVFAGKAHPADEPGRYFIHEVLNFCNDHKLGGHVAFLEDYDMHMAKYLVQGVDIWLNTPRAPLEASGTSGKKAALNGVINLSVLDGWWQEGYNGANGWGIDPLPPSTDQHRMPTMPNSYFAYWNKKSYHFSINATLTARREDGFKLSKNALEPSRLSSAPNGWSRNTSRRCTAEPLPARRRHGKSLRGGTCISCAAECHSCGTLLRRYGWSVSPPCSTN